MKISELVRALTDFKSSHGDVDVDAEYWCADCRDTHEGKGWELELHRGKLRLSVIRLGEE